MKPVYRYCFSRKDRNQVLPRLISSEAFQRTDYYFRRNGKDEYLIELFDQVKAMTFQLMFSEFVKPCKNNELQ